MNHVILLRRPVSRQGMQRELEDLFQREWGHPRPAGVWHRDGLWQPQVDVYEVSEALLVLVELAGMRDSEIEITVSDDALLLSGRRPELHREGTLRFHQLGINEGPFQAAILLPGAVDVEAISADYDDGMLTITLPKHKAQARRIGITNKNA